MLAPGISIKFKLVISLGDSNRNILPLMLKYLVVITELRVLT